MNILLSLLVSMKLVYVYVYVYLTPVTHTSASAHTLPLSSLRHTNHHLPPSTPLWHHHHASIKLTSTITDIARSRITLALRRHVGPPILHSLPFTYVSLLPEQEHTQIRMDESSNHRAKLWWPQITTYHIMLVMVVTTFELLRGSGVSAPRIPHTSTSSGLITQHNTTYVHVS